MNKVYYIVYVKGKHKYVYRFDSVSTVALTQLLCKQAADPDLDLYWQDAAAIVRAAKDITKKHVRF
jgi:hypothetical protein